MSIPFLPLFFQEPKKDEFIPLVPTTDEYTSPNSDLLRQAVEDAMNVRLAALANAKAAFNDAFASHTPPPTHSLNEIDSGVSKAIEDVKPQIGYPGYVKPTLPPVSKEPELSKEQEKLNRFGMTIPNRDFLKELIESDIGEAKEEGDYDDVIDTYSNAISGPLDPTYYKPNPDPSGAFQRSLKPKSNTNDNYDFIVAIGNPHSNRLILNCIENSRNELIHFKDNIKVIQEAIDKFNVDYDPQSMTKTILAGRNEKNYLNISLQFDSLDFDGVEIRAHFSKHDAVACSGNVDYVKCIKETVYFYLKGELYLNENETKIESMEITALNYANPSRNIISEKFVYLH
jgi:hypothetical protein